MNIKTVHVCIGTSMELDEQEEIAIVKEAIASSRRHNNAFEQIFKYVVDNNIMIERTCALLPFTSDEDLPKRTRDMFMENRPDFDYNKKPNYVMHFKIKKEGRDHTVAVFFLFD